MEPEQRRAAKQQMLKWMEAGVSWQEAAATAGVQTSRATAYRWKQEARIRGEAALHDGRHGHPAKVLPAVLHWLESRCRETALIASSHLQKELQEQLGVQISISHLNAVRAAHGWSNVAIHVEKIWQERKRTFNRESEGSYCWQPPRRRVCSPIWKRRLPRVGRQPLGLCSPVPRIAFAN